MASSPLGAARKIPLEPRIDTGMPDEDQELRVSYFIPSVELTGSRAERLAKLDTLIRHLETVRHQLAGDLPPAAMHEGPSRDADSPDWPWFVAGALVGALLLLLALAARSCAAAA